MRRKDSKDEAKVVEQGVGIHLEEKKEGVFINLEDKKKKKKKKI